MPKAKQTKKSGNGTKAKTKCTAASETSAATGAEPKKPRRRQAQPADLDALHAKAAEAKDALTVATNEANALRLQGVGIEAAAKKTYLEALGPYPSTGSGYPEQARGALSAGASNGYRDACRKAGVDCDFAGARAANKTPAVRFLVEKVAGGIKVVIKGRPETEEVITKKALEESIGKAAFGYTDRWLGTREEIGAKGAGLSNRLRAVLAES